LTRAPILPSTNDD